MMILCRLVSNIIQKSQEKFPAYCSLLSDRMNEIDFYSSKVKFTVCIGRIGVCF